MIYINKMLRYSSLRFLGPRFKKNAPPQLTQKGGEFRCDQCSFWWKSNFVWVTKHTNVCYQGQQCERCGHYQRPYYVMDLTKAWQPGAPSNCKGGIFPGPLTTKSLNKEARNRNKTQGLITPEKWNRGRN